MRDADLSGETRSRLATLLARCLRVPRLMACLLLLRRCRIALDEYGGIERLVGLLLAPIDRDPGTRVNDFVAENENGVFLDRVGGMQLEAGDPGRSAKVIDRPNPGDLHRSRHGVRKDACDVVGDNLPIVRLGKISLERRIGKVLGDAAGCASGQSNAKREDAKTQDRSTC